MRHSLTNFVKATGAFLGSALEPDGIHYRIIVGPMESVTWMFARLHADDVGQWTEARIFFAEHPLFPSARHRSPGTAIAAVEQKLALLYEFNALRIAAHLRNTKEQQCFPMDLWGKVLGDLISSFRLQEDDFYAGARDRASAEFFPALHRLLQFEGQFPHLTGAAFRIDEDLVQDGLTRARADRGSNVIPFPARARP